MNYLQFLTASRRVLTASASDMSSRLTAFTSTMTSPTLIRPSTAAGDLHRHRQRYIKTDTDRQTEICTDTLIRPSTAAGDLHRQTELHQDRHRQTQTDRPRLTEIYRGTHCCWWPTQTQRDRQTCRDRHSYIQTETWSRFQICLKKNQYRLLYSSICYSSSHLTLLQYHTKGRLLLYHYTNAFVTVSSALIWNTAT